MKKFFETNLSRNRCVQSVCIKGSISSKNVSAIIRFSRPHDVSLAVLKSGLPSKNIEEGDDGGLGSCPFSFSRQLSSYRADVVISCKENRLPRWNRKKKISRLKESKEIQELFVYDIIFFIDLYNYSFRVFILEYIKKKYWYIRSSFPLLFSRCHFSIL